MSRPLCVKRHRACGGGSCTCLGRRPIKHSENKIDKPQILAFYWCREGRWRSGSSNECSSLCTVSHIHITTFVHVAPLNLIYLCSCSCRCLYWCLCWCLCWCVCVFSSIFTWLPFVCLHLCGRTEHRRPRLSMNAMHHARSRTRHWTGTGAGAGAGFT